ncbi:hypothetical protein N7475_007554 [Penicillium sp. IBT 31633x]|nr:hypothetical protein N7475_007554 [Penicillium sp. IBT 31633x]
MARLSNAFTLFALLGATLVTAYNQTLQHENADCDNNCFWDSFPGGSCTNDVACMCSQQQYREAYFCCMGKNCNPNVLPDSITRQRRECNARDMAFTFDAEAICGVKLTTSAGVLVAATSTSTSTTATATATVTTTAADSTVTGDKSSTASASATSAASSTVISETSAGNQTTSASSTPIPTNGAPGNEAIWNAVMILVAVSAVALC